MKLSKYRFAAFVSSLVTLIMIFGTLFPSANACGAEERKDVPPRKISLAPEYTRVITEEGKDLSVDLIIANGGRRDEDIKLSLPSVPEGWKAWIKTYTYAVTGIHVPRYQFRNLTLKAEPQKSVAPGEYVFSIRAESNDNKLVAINQLTVTVEGKKQAKPSKGVQITTSYPVLEGPTDSKFEFSIEVENKSDEDTIYNLGARGPQNWEINFKPAYEEKFISSLRIKGKQKQSVEVEVKPYISDEPGEYLIKVQAHSEKHTAEAETKIVLTGTHKLGVATKNGLLSLTTSQGKETKLHFYVKNTGSGTHKNITFLSFKPENWEIVLKPEKLETLSPGDTKEVEATITPAEQALVGDYSVSVSIDAEKTSKSLDLRVGIKASEAWAWLGIVIIAFVLGGLIILFMRLGRP